MATAQALPLARPSSNLRNYVLVTAAYWADTLTDGAIRMLVLLYFNQHGYTAIEVAMLFLFYEVFGIVTNLVGGWMAARLGLKTTLFAGLGMQVVALSMLALVQPAWLTVPYVMVAQALSGIAKDLTKMSSKSAIKFVVADDAQSTLFKWVAILTGSKNALKGVGFFVGGLLALPRGFSRVPVHPGGTGADCPDLHRSADEGRPRAPPTRRRSSARCSRTTGPSTSSRRRASFCSPRATCGSSSACRSSCTPCWAGTSGRSAASWRSGSSATGSCRPAPLASCAAATKPGAARPMA